MTKFACEPLRSQFMSTCNGNNDIA
ncbi:hypothetical protein NC653_024056 [Populus alba x Populus x berolinensis]|uniref:Uncharacterized protein n=1 Tax=Populus alba x Populus x berolinensis TaxID=444605 RepID=A0AAD6MJG3_9ROSI|nr:hypothetical protein NC653_024056 [Populus alba x Populus x berolinensis]